jgi:NTE family protein
MRSGPSVSLVLGSGGARGLTHIGIIQWLEAQGYQIQSIAGCSMGALVGGIHAAGKLDRYRDWVCALRRTDVLRFLDLAFHPAGLIKGDRIMDRLREMVGEHQIERLPINFTAVATDIERQREVWITKGPLFDAIRASIAVPTLFTPHRYLGLTLLDGGLLNPVPIAPTFRDLTDLTIAVNLNAGPAAEGQGQPSAKVRAQASAEAQARAPARAHGMANNQVRMDDRAKTLAQAKTPVPSSELARGENSEPPAATEAPKAERDDLRSRILDFLDSIGSNLMPDADRSQEAEELGLFELMSQSFETMQNAITAMKLAAYAPDVLIEVPRDTCQAHEFHRARELIEVGYRIADHTMGGLHKRPSIVD